MKEEKTTINIIFLFKFLEILCSSPEEQRAIDGRPTINFEGSTPDSTSLKEPWPLNSIPEVMAWTSG